MSAQHPEYWADDDPSAVAAPYSPWRRRAVAWIIDFTPSLLAQLIFMAGYVRFAADVAVQSGSGTRFSPSPSGVAAMIMGLVFGLAALIWQLYNRWVVAGRTGQSLGKRAMRLDLLSEQTRQPIGFGNAFLRDVVHLLDGVALVGYLWPLWDAKRQTFADKLTRTVVVDSPPPREPRLSAWDVVRD